LRDEVETGEGVEPSKGAEEADKSEEVDSPDEHAPISKGTSYSVPIAVSEYVNQAYIAENLVFQDLQNELGGGVFRNVVLNIGGARHELDGVVRAGDEVVGVEIKFARELKMVSSRVDSALRQASRVLSAGKGRRSSPTRYIVAIVLGDGANLEEARRIALSRRSSPEITVRVFSLAELMRKYGLPPFRPS
jgi:hypothetical protein